MSATLREVLIDNYVLHLAEARHEIKARGIGIDEDTAAVVRASQEFEVAGGGSVYIVDGRDLTYSNVSVDQARRAVSAFDIRVHVLSRGDCFDVAARRPSPAGGV